jgi:hypothetical protein
VPDVSVKLLTGEGKTLLIRNDVSGQVEVFKPYVFSQSSLLLILYAIPTLATGIACKFRPMLAGGILCYVFFIISCFTPSMYDYFMNGLAGVFSWLIPGLILRKRYLKARTANV